MAILDTLDFEEAAPPPAEPAPVGLAKFGRLKQFIAKTGRRKRLIAITIILGLGVVGTTYVVGLIGKLTGGTDPQAMKTSSIDLPEIISNLNAGSHRTAYVRLKARLELVGKPDEAVASEAQPRMKDLFQTYFRDMRPDELRGSAGTYRLREELIARANIALAPARVTDILFEELLVQ